MLRYGDELGMGENLRLKERDAIRTPMQWSAARNGGFSTAEKTVRPVVASGSYSYEAVNVEAQRRDPSSLLRALIELIRLRKECPEIGSGEWELPATGSRHVLAILHRWRGTALLCVHNLDARPRSARLELDALLSSLTDEATSAPDARGVHRLELDGYGRGWYRVTEQG